MISSSTAILVGILLVLGFWALVLTGSFLNARQLRPALILLARIIYVVITAVLVLVFFKIID